MKSYPASKPSYPNLKANLLMTLLVLGVPICAKLILLHARAAASQQVLATDPMSVARRDHTTCVAGHKIDERHAAGGRVQ